MVGHFATPCERCSMRVIGILGFHSLFDFASLRLRKTIQTMCFCFCWFRCVPISREDCSTDGAMSNAASLKLVEIYSSYTFTLALAFYGLRHSAKIFKRCKTFVNWKQCLEFLLDVTLLRSWKASSAVSSFFWFLYLCALMWCGPVLWMSVHRAVVFLCRSVPCPQRY